MMPRIGQRLLIATLAGIAALMWLVIARALTPGDSGGGLTITAAHVGWLPAILVVLVGTGIATLLALIATVRGHPVGGLFAVTLGLTIAAGVGGGSGDWLRTGIVREALPERYVLLVIEAFIWQGMILVIVLNLRRWRQPLRLRFPHLARHARDTIDIPRVQSENPLLPLAETVVLGALALLGFTIGFNLIWGVFLAIGIGLMFAARKYVTEHARWLSQTAAMLVSTAVAGVIVHLLVKAGDPKQVIWSLLIAFTAGGLCAQLLHPRINPIGAIASPLLLAILGYGHVLIHGDSTETVAAMWYAGNLPGAALPLPIHYASAGVAGVCLGVGWAHGFLRRPAESGLDDDAVAET